MPSITYLRFLSRPINCAVTGAIAVVEPHNYPLQYCKLRLCCKIIWTACSVETDRQEKKYSKPPGLQEAYRKFEHVCWTLRIIICPPLLTAMPAWYDLSFKVLWRFLWTVWQWCPVNSEQLGIDELRFFLLPSVVANLENPKTLRYVPRNFQKYCRQKADIIIMT